MLVTSFQDIRQFVFKLISISFWQEAPICRVLTFIIKAPQYGDKFAYRLTLSSGSASDTAYYGLGFLRPLYMTRRTSIRMAITFWLQSVKYDLSYNRNFGASPIASCKGRRLQERVKNITFIKGENITFQTVKVFI